MRHMRHIDYSAIERRLRGVFPNLEVWAPTDRTFLTADLGEIEHLINIFPARPWSPGINECEEIARWFCAQVADRQLDQLQAGLLPVDLRYSLALGEAMGDRIRGEARDHTLNVFLTEDTVMLLDMQTGAYWPAVRGEDNIFFVRM